MAEDYGRNTKRKQATCLHAEEVYVRHLKTLIVEWWCHADLLCPRCRVLTEQAGGDTNSKMAPTTGTHSILVPETKTTQI